MRPGDYIIPLERARQFALINSALATTLAWAQNNLIPLEYIYPVVPFIDSDYSVAVWLFLDSEQRIREYQDGCVAESLKAKLRKELLNAGYPEEWLILVTFHFGSKEVVDRDFEGNYLFFLR